MSKRKKMHTYPYGFTHYVVDSEIIDYNDRLTEIRENLAKPPRNTDFDTYIFLSKTSWWSLTHENFQKDWLILTGYHKAGFPLKVIRYI
jgi:hypothetical protein